MKYLNILILLFPLAAFGQDLNQAYGGTNAKWVYNFTGMYEGVTVVEQSRDTLVGSRLLTIFEKATFFEDDYGEMGVWNRAPVFVHSNEGVVEFSTDLIHFDTLFNFRLEIGDSWVIKERDLAPGQLEGDTILRTIVDTFSVERGGGLVFCQAVRWGENTEIDTIYQDFGSIFSYILPFENRKAYGEGNILRCFTNDRLGPLDFEADFMAACPYSFLSDFEYDCGVISSTSSARNSDFSMYPNPASDYLRLQSENTPIENVKVYNLHGVFQKEKQTIGQEIEMNINDLSPGVYILLINDSYYEKVVVQE